MPETFDRRSFIKAGGAALATFASLSPTEEAHAEARVEDEARQEESKEFQLKLDIGRMDLGDQRQTDARLYAMACEALATSVTALAGNAKRHLHFTEAPIVREAIRYDTSPKSSDGLFRKRWLSLAIEATKKQTKLKCKHHSFVPELLFANAGDSVCYPSDPPLGHTKPRFKIEQDIHFNNTKTCASGSVHIPGRRTDVEDVSFFSRHFGKLESLCAPDTRLHAVSHWQETVFEGLGVGWGKVRFANMMLVNRWDFETNTLLESELAFKIRKPLGAEWNYEQLGLSSKLYAALHATGNFRQDPPIFYYFDPVSSVEIQKT